MNIDDFLFIPVQSAKKYKNKKEKCNQVKYFCRFRDETKEKY